MNPNDLSERSHSIAAKAKELGASLAGIASVTALRDAPSHVDCGQTAWPAEAKSVLALALVHDPSEPHLDWWGSWPGATPGNQMLIETAERLRDWLDAEQNITAHPLPYQPTDGGVFLKDAAALAGLGIIGKNNLLITPEYGPRVRLRALFLEVELEPTLPSAFAPCDQCDAPCLSACPQKAFPEGHYSKPHCQVQMDEDEANREPLDAPQTLGSVMEVVRFCRACEFACPVGDGTS